MNETPKVFAPITLPCSRVVSNRLVKVAMYEHLSNFLGGPPNQNHFGLYSTWAKHDWGMVITGNVQVSERHLSLGRDMVIPNRLCEKTLAPWKELARCIHGELYDKENKTLAIMQLNHSGRQSSNIIGGRAPFSPPIAPSAIRTGSTSKDSGIISDIFHYLLFQTPRSMSLEDIEIVIEQFVKGAKLAEETGFDGIQLHMAHGYLLSQFISPKANIRVDSYSISTSENALRLLRRIVSAIRGAVRKDFVLGIKLNTSDYSLDDSSESKQDQEEVILRHICEVAQWRSVDFIEISGGDYENPDFLTSSKSRSSRQAFFAHFSSRAMDSLHKIRYNDTKKSSESNSNPQPPPPPLPLILLTGGLRTPAHLYTALSSNHTHLLGIGRMSLLCPSLPSILRQLESSRSMGSSVGSRNLPKLLDNLTPFKSLPEPDLSLPFTQRWPWAWIWKFIPKIRLVGAGVGMAWYLIIARAWATCRVSVDEEEDRLVRNLYRVGGLEAVIRMWIWSEAPEFQLHGLQWAVIAAVSIFFLASILFIYPG